MARIVSSILCAATLVLLTTVFSRADEAVKMTPEEEARYKEGLKDPYVQFVRKVLDQCLEVKFKNDDCYALERNKVAAEELAGKFIVYWVEPKVAMGGVGIAIIFLKNPNKIYNAIIFTSGPPSQPSYRLHDFYQADASEENMKEVHKVIEPILTREDMAL